MKTAGAAAFTVLLATTFAHPSFAQTNQDQYDQSSDQNEYGPGMQRYDRNWRQDRSWPGNDESSGSNWHRHGMERIWQHHGFRHQNEAARFRLRRGDSMIDIRCPVNETLQVCVNAASQLLDKVGQMPNVTSPTGASTPSNTQETPRPSVTVPGTTTPTR
jgi:hypothetical protein